MPVPVPVPAPAPAGDANGDPTLERYQEFLNANFGAIENLIPSRYAFTEGETGTQIVDGGNDMFDGGNILTTNFNTQGIPYSNNLIRQSNDFGPNSRYFTRKFPNLFVLVGENVNAQYFRTWSDFGSDG